MNACYEPIACAFHSVLEEAVLRGEAQEIVYRDGNGALWCRRQRLEDVYAMGSVAFVRIGSGAEIRLARIVRSESDVGARARAGRAAPGCPF